MPSGLEKDRVDCGFLWWAFCFFGLGGFGEPGGGGGSFGEGSGVDVLGWMFGGVL